MCKTKNEKQTGGKNEHFKRTFRKSKSGKNS